MNTQLHLARGIVVGRAHTDRHPVLLRTLELAGSSRVVTAGRGCGAVSAERSGSLARMDQDSLRSIDLTRTGQGRYEATNSRGGALPIGSGEGSDFTPVELLLAAIAGCSAIDVDLITGKRVTADVFDVRAEGHKVRDERGNHLVGLKVTFDVVFPEGDDGERARAMLPRALQQTRDRLCSVGRTVALGEPIEYVGAQ